MLSAALNKRTNFVCARSVNLSSVTLFAFANGEGLSEHTAAFDALVICVEGEAEIQILGQTYRLQEDETITMPANQPHSIKAASNFKMLLVMIKA
jgi:quercetin dioxygenase-like cupin family protein